MYTDPTSIGSWLITITSLIVIGIIFIVITVKLLSTKNNGGTLWERLIGGTKNNKIVYDNFPQNIPQEKQILFSMQYESVKKSPTIAVLLALFFGGIGMHKFYMGQIGMGILYFLFSPTFIPLAISLIEVFLISGQVTRYNQQKATEIALMLGVTSSNAPTLSKTTQPNLCIECGKYYEGQPKFCPNCGKEINPAKPTAPVEPKTAPKSNLLSQAAKKSSVKLCPKCGIPMEIKIANQGAQQGKRFYVCPNYKQCQQVFPFQ
jgi:TM2 domain-containing membrane protein YozV/predicted RNA-binding Zn-ribbon protein involved in translation (DUF1610 family)